MTDKQNLWNLHETTRHFDLFDHCLDAAVQLITRKSLISLQLIGERLVLCRPPFSEGTI